jgi:hypothetical protein
MGIALLDKHILERSGKETVEKLEEKDADELQG